MSPEGPFYPVEGLAAYRLLLAATNRETDVQAGSPQLPAGKEDGVLRQRQEGERPGDAARLEELSAPHSRGGAASWDELRHLVASDLHRYAGRAGLRAFLRNIVFTPGFKYSSWMRLCGYLRRTRLGRLTLYPLAKLVLLHYRYKYGIAIPEYTSIGPGLLIIRFGGVMVNGDAVIGSNFCITHGAMVGQTNRGSRIGSPTIGDRVYLAAGSKMLGGITLGDDVAVGANAVVTKDVPPNGVAVGIPAKVISLAGSAGYVNRVVTDS